MRSGLALAGVVLLVPAVLSAQHVVSARAGLIHHSDGQVFLDNKPLRHKVTEFPELRENQRLRTEEGRAEMLLTPGIFLRLGPSSNVEMLSTRLWDVRLRLLGGSAVVEADEVPKDNSVTLLVGDTEVHLPRAGLYRLDVAEGEDPRLRVFAGEAVVKGQGGEYRVKGKKEIDLAGDFSVRKFDVEETDPLDRWSKRRAGYLSMASVSAGRMAYRSGMSFASSRWVYNPYFGLVTFLPYRDICWSPYGYGFYSPRAVYYLYNPPRMQNPVQTAGAGYNPNYGYRTMAPTSGGTSGVIAASPSSPASAGAAAPGGGPAISRGGETSGGGARR